MEESSAAFLRRAGNVGSRKVPIDAVNLILKGSAARRADRERETNKSEGKLPMAAPSASADGTDPNRCSFVLALCQLAEQRLQEAVDLLTLVCDEHPIESENPCDGTEVLLYAALGFGLRAQRKFGEANKAFRHAQRGLLSLIKPSTVGNGTPELSLPLVLFTAGIAACLKGHHAWKLCCLDLKNVLALARRPSVPETPQIPTAQSKAAEKKGSWALARSSEVDMVILVHHSLGTALALKKDSSGSFRFAAGQSGDEYVCSEHGQVQDDVFDQPELGVLKAALQPGEGKPLGASFIFGPWQMDYCPINALYSVKHAAWEPRVAISLNEDGFEYRGAASSIQVKDGELIDRRIVTLVDVEKCYPDLIFRIGVALGNILMDDVSKSANSASMLQKIDQMLTAEKACAELVVNAQMLADGGTHLHMLAHSGDSTRLSAALQDLSRCLSVSDQARQPQQELADGDEVRLSPDYRRYRDAASGPLAPADIGVIVAVQQGSTQPLRVSYGGRSWWYAREALEAVEPPRRQKMEEKCSCVNCINRPDRKGRTALHVVASCLSGRSHLLACKELVHAGACLHLRDHLGRTPLHCLLESPCVKAKATSFAILRTAVKLLVSEKVLRIQDNERRSPILAAALSEEHGAIIVFDSLLNTEFDWAWMVEAEELLTLANKRSKSLEKAPPQHRHAAESALARLLGKHISESENEGLCACPKSGQTLALNLPVSCEEVAVHSVFDAFGIRANSQDATFWEGVQRNVSVDRLLKGGWKLHESTLYNHPTKLDNLDPGKGEWLCIGAREVGKDVLLLAAMAKRKDVLRRTAGASEANQSNGVYWYCCPGKSFGFSRHPRVDLRSADTEDADGEFRLSWHLGSDSGGWRAGMKKNLVRETGARYEKLVFYLKPLKTMTAEPYEHFFIGRHVTIVDGKSSESGDQHQPIPSCWGTQFIEDIRSSSNTAQLARLMDGSVTSYWESNRDASADRKHWLEFHLKPRHTIKKFGLIVSADTAKYCPRTLVTSVGQSAGCLKSLGQSEHLDLPLDEPVLLPLIRKPTVATIIRVEINDQHLGDNCRVYGVCVEVLHGQGASKSLEMRSGRVVEQGEGNKWLVVMSFGSAKWFCGSELKALGPTFPPSISLRDLKITALPSAVKLRGVGSFPLQALQHLCLADNKLVCLPDDFASALPGLLSLDLSGNLFSELPCAIAHFAWLRSVSMCQQKDTLREDMWLDAIIVRVPTFLENPPQALESVMVDFACTSLLSRKLVTSLAMRAIQRASSTCIDLRGRGLGDDALESILPQLLECCRRRQGFVDSLQHSANTTSAVLHVPFIHPHPLLSASHAEMAIINDCCDACGRTKLSPNTGVVCENLGCDFSLCVECTAFLSHVPRGSLRTVDADGRHVQFVFDCIGRENPDASASGKPQSSHGGAKNLLPSPSLLDVLIDGELAIQSVEAIRWNSSHSVMTMEKGPAQESLNLHLRNDVVAAGLVIELQKMCALAKLPGIAWCGDAASRSPVCHVQGHVPMSISAKIEGSDPENIGQWKCGECCSAKAGTGWHCQACNLHYCLQCWPPSELTVNDACNPDNTIDSESWSDATAMQIDGVISGVQHREGKEIGHADTNSVSHDLGEVTHGLKVPLVDLRDNPITRIPPMLLSAVSCLGAGAIISDLCDHSKDVKTVIGSCDRSIDDSSSNTSDDIQIVTSHRLTPAHKYLYTGEVMGNKEHGKGKRIFCDSSTLEGSFAEGKRHGPAVHTFKNGETWNLSFKADELEKNAVLSKPGCKYEGEVKQELKENSPEQAQYKPHGHGIMAHFAKCSSKATCYHGCWKDGKRHGQGTLTWYGPPRAKMQMQETGSKGKEAVEEESSSQCGSGAGAVVTYEGAWEDDVIQGQGVLRWPDGRTFHGTFVSDRLERGFLMGPEGSCMLVFSELCPKLEKDVGAYPELPPAIKRQDMGMISADLMSAVKRGASEAYAQLVRAVGLSVADRIKLLSLHASENPPEGGRQALKIDYAPGTSSAATSILQALIQGVGSDLHHPAVSVAKNLQWALEVVKPEVGRSAMVLEQKGSKAMLKEDLKRELERRGLDTKGLKSVLEARLEEALILERPLKAAEIKMPLLKRELEKRGLDTRGLKRELLARLEEVIEKDKAEGAKAEEVKDEIQEMFYEAGQGLSGIQRNGFRPMILTAAESLQPEPVASSPEKMKDLRKWYEALGRLIGGALWHQKTLPIPLSRFFCRRILEMVPAHRIKAYSVQGTGPPVFSGGALALLGTHLTVQREDRYDDHRWKHCPLPRLYGASVGIACTVKEVESVEGRWFVKIEERSSGQVGWLPASSTNVKVEHLIQPEAARREMRCQIEENPYKACFPRSISSGQPVRVRAVLPPPSFYNAKHSTFESNKAAEDMHPGMARLVQDESDREYARCLAANMPEEKAKFLSEIAADQVRVQ